MKTAEENYCECGVPASIHGLMCGWEAANTIIFPWEMVITAGHTPMEKQLRYKHQNQSMEFLKSIGIGIGLSGHYRDQPHLPAINALSQKMYGCDYSEVHLPERRAELLEKYLGIEREA